MGYGWSQIVVVVDLQQQHVWMVNLCSSTSIVNFRLVDLQIDCCSKQQHRNHFRRSAQHQQAKARRGQNWHTCYLGERKISFIIMKQTFICMWNGFTTKDCCSHSTFIWSISWMISIYYLIVQASTNLIDLELHSIERNIHWTKWATIAIYAQFIM